MKHLSVVNPMAIGSPDENDLEFAVYSALAHTDTLNPSYIFVTARGSEITLAGWVHKREEVSLADEITLTINGVKNAHNELSPDL